MHGTFNIALNMNPLVKFEAVWHNLIANKSCFQAALCCEANAKRIGQSSGCGISRRDRGDCNNRQGHAAVRVWKMLALRKPIGPKRHLCSLGSWGMVDTYPPKAPGTPNEPLQRTTDGGDVVNSPGNGSKIYGLCYFIGHLL